MKAKVFEVLEFSKAVFDGFTLKRGYMYGTDNKGHPFATSTCVKNNNLCVYVKEEGKWIQKWIPMDTIRKDCPALFKKIVSK